MDWREKYLNNLMISAHNHITREHEGIPCTICGELVSTQRMKRHVYKYHKPSNEWDFKCKFCGKGFLQTSHLKAHINVHTGEKPYMCDFCGTTFAAEPNWRTHVKSVHKGQKRIKNKIKRKVQAKQQDGPMEPETLEDSGVTQDQENL